MEKIIYLFTYGTLQDERLHHAFFQKKLEGFEDKLVAYRISEAKADGVYLMAEHTGDEKDSIEGIVYEIVEEDLKAADEYEGALYQRISVTLISGKNAWVYITV
ncbi:MAG TPA: gamma-glutamylcyclotransferase [Pricia antarctica]|uniref:Gamma-glutamylcyclotransferase n=2 Tax=root TaxID=1 RepID=A0A831VU56_9FLAO|nr:gamma-glutamylcyclotransferase [Pricia antarctica]